MTDELTPHPDGGARDRPASTQIASSDSTAHRLTGRIARLDAFGLDIKLGFRTLLKSWGLTLLGGATMAVAITVAAALFSLLQVLVGTDLPLDEGDGLVVVQPFDPETLLAQGTSLEDFERWRTELRAVEDVGAFRTIQRALVTPTGPAPPITVAEMSAAGFEAARVAPLIGRFLLPEDEAAGAAPVVVIGYDAWQSTFGGDPNVLGRIVQLDDVFHTIVGVMPEDFAFPVNHQYWTSLRTSVADPVVVFARLTPGTTLESARAEVETLGLLEPANPSGGSELRRPRVVGYVAGLQGGQPMSTLVSVLSLLLPLLLIPPCANVAILVYARTVARQGELAARTALGATRARLVGQIFIEVLVLTIAAAGLALVLTPRLVAFVGAAATPGMRLPFWIDLGLSYSTIGYAGGLAVVAALIAGAIPAFRATGSVKLACLHALGARATPRLGKVWTSLVLLHVALSVAVLPMGAEIAWTLSGAWPKGLRFAPDEYLSAGLTLDATATPDAIRFANIRDELLRRLEAEPGVRGITVAEALPSQEPQLRVRTEDSGSTATTAFNRVDLRFFETFNTRTVIGRGFEPRDLEAGGGVIVVNRSFARRVLGDGNPLGLRLRTIASAPDRIAAMGGDQASAGPWLEVVGVVEDFSAEGGRPTLYQLLPRIPDRVPLSDDPTDSGAPRLSLAMHAGPTIPAELPDRVREIAASLDPDLRVDPVRVMYYEAFWIEDRTLASWLAGALLGVVLFSVAGIYTLVSFTVVQRRHEIAIRSALGAPPWRLIAGISRRILVPVSIGVGLGALAAILMEYYWSPALFEFREGGRPLPWVLPIAEALLIIVAVIAAAGPSRRALEIDPIEDLGES